MQTQLVSTLSFIRKTVFPYSKIYKTMAFSKKNQGFFHRAGVTHLYDEEDILEELNRSLQTIEGYVPSQDLFYEGASRTEDEWVLN